MNTIHNNGENDQSLKDDLDKLGQAYRQLPQDEPPELLDQAILNSAHRAVENKPHWMQFGWLHGLTTTAVFVLALSLIFNQREQVPVFEDTSKVNEQIGSQRERAAKKQTEDAKVRDLRMEMKEESEKRQDVIQAVPATEASQGAAMEGVSADTEFRTRDQALPASSAARLSTSAVRNLAVKSDSTDKDTASNEPIAEELLVDEADSVADTPDTENLYKQTLPAENAAPAAGETEAVADDTSQIEQKLLDIIKLKQAGDKAWTSELALFKQQYPDYPLPDELSN